MIIRKAVHSDAGSICRTHILSISRLCCTAYTPDQINAWTENMTPQRYIHGMDNHEFHVADTGTGEVAGFIIFNAVSGEIYALYIVPWASRRGLGRQFIDLAQSTMQGTGHKVMQVKSTLNAVEFYEHAGFHVESESTHNLSNGEILPCMHMVKSICRN